MNIFAGDAVKRGCSSRLLYECCQISRFPRIQGVKTPNLSRKRQKIPSL
jgi:hypothetical protein